MPKKLSEMTEEELTQYWNKYATDHLVGKTIVRARYMSEEEKENVGFYSKALVLELSDGSLIFPSKDDEGNDAGALFGLDNDNNNLTFPVL